MGIRSFIAINLPDSLKKELGFLIEKLKKENKRIPIKWVLNEGLHITLHFLGSQNEEKLKKVGEIIEKKIREFHLSQNSIKLTIVKIDAFPNLNRPRVLYLACHEDNEKKLLQRFQKELGKELEKIGIEIEKRDWVPHITLARFKSSVKPSISNFQILNPTFEVKSIDLMKSDLTPDGAKYTILKKFQF